MSKELVDVEDLTLVHSTSKAYLVKNLDDEKFWIPISQVDYLEFGRDFNGDDGKPLREIKRMTLPEWLAEDKGLI